MWGMWKGAGCDGLDGMIGLGSLTQWSEPLLCSGWCLKLRDGLLATVGPIGKHQIPEEREVR